MKKGAMMARARGCYGAGGMLLALAFLMASCPLKGPEREETRSAMTFTFIDACNDNVGPAIGLYDVTKIKAHREDESILGEYILRGVEAPEEVGIECVRGDYICYGAWVDEGRSFWGCGRECREACDSCCVSCDDVPVRPVRLLCGGGIENQYGRAPSGP